MSPGRLLHMARQFGKTALTTMLWEQRIEPVKRRVGGIYTWAIHRFPIKGGISAMEAMRRDNAEQLGRPSTILRVLRERQRT